MKTIKVEKYLKDIPGFYLVAQKDPLEDLIVYVHTKEAKRQVKERLAKRDFGVNIDVKTMSSKMVPAK